MLINHIVCDAYQHRVGLDKSHTKSSKKKSQMHIKRMVILRDFLTKLKGLADDKLNITLQVIPVLDREENICWKRRKKHWLSAFSPPPTMASKGFLYMGV